MGVLNVTPDSFYDGGKYFDEETLVNQIHQMLHEGVDIIDVGGMSSRPGATIIPEEEEISRIKKPIQLIRQISQEISISIDTLRVKVAEVAIQEGANIVNDISGGDYDQSMFEFIASNQLPYCLMHMLGTPETMQSHITYTSMHQEIYDYFERKISQLTQLGYKKRPIIDPGFGFSKTLDQNYELLSKLTFFKELACEILVGVSRKSMAYKFLEISPDKALNASTVLHTFALLNGANILRVHDVKEAVQAIKIISKLNTNL